MARSSDPDSAGCQFFICVADSPFLDGKYTAFGRVLNGMDVADKIVNAARDAKDNPMERIEMKVSLVE
jgi:peptidyl-prolyl cis-trans isomerase B (cyclophilin B)